MVPHCFVCTMNIQPTHECVQMRWRGNGGFMTHQSDPFQDADNNGYLATQLSHLPKVMGYGPGNLLSYLPL